MAPLCQAWEIGIDHLQITLDCPAPVFAGIGSREQIFFARQVPEAVPPFHHLNDPATHQQRRIEAVHTLATIFDAALGDLTTLGTQQIRNGLERGRLASSIGTQEGHNGPLGNLERDAFEDEDDVVIDHFDITDLEHGGALWLHASPFLPVTIAATEAHAKCKRPPRQTGGGHCGAQH